MTMKRILLLFLLFCGGYVHAQELGLDSARIHYRQGHREVDVLFRDNRAELERLSAPARRTRGGPPRKRRDTLVGIARRCEPSQRGAVRAQADSLKAYLVRHAGIPDSLICIHGEGIAWTCCARWSLPRTYYTRKRCCISLTIRPYGCSTRQAA